jgi:hypothetical protein
MATNRAPYKDPANNGRWTIDVDPDDEVFYAANVIQWVTDAGTTVASFEPITNGVTVLLKGTAQGDRNGLLPVKLKVPFAETGDTFCTFRTATTDGQQFDKTIWFKRVEN